MRRSLTRQSSGFTLVEVLVISPIIILFIGAFIALLVNLTGETLTIREKNTAAYDTQAALDDIESAVTKATGFMATTGTVPVPQGKGNSTSSGTPFTSTTSGEADTLIIKAAATDLSPSNASRTLIYTGTGSCDSRNPLYTYMTIFFVADDPDTADTTDKALYKRTILPQIAACKSPWQRGSCAASVTASYTSVCKTTDDKLLGNISAFTVQYFTGTSSATADTANSVSVNLATTKQVAGNSVSYAGKTRAASVNTSTTDSTQSTPPSNPPITFTRDAAFPNPYRTTFSWASVGNATSYIARYKVGTGSWVEQTVAQSSSPSFSVDASYRKQSVSFELNVVTNAGTYSYGTAPTVPDIPRWNDCTTTGNWVNYDATGTGYTEAGFTRTSTQAVGLKGLVKSGTVGYYAANTYPVCTLPVGFRPMSRQIFEVIAYDSAATNGRGWGRVDVDVDGTVSVVSGTNSFVSLDGIIFATSSTPVSWSNGVTSGTSFANGWNYNNYGGEDYGTPRYGVDSTGGRAWFEGLATQGTVNRNILATLPTSMRPSQSMHIPSQGGGVINIGADGTTNARAVNSYRSMQFIYYPSSFNSWRTLVFQNSSTNYGSGWSTGQCYRGPDDIVIVKGLITGGNMTYPAVLTDLTAATGGSCGAPNTGGAMIMSMVANPDVSASVDLYVDGKLIITKASTGWTSLDGFHFIAD